MVQVTIFVIAALLASTESATTVRDSSLQQRSPDVTAYIPDIQLFLLTNGAKVQNFFDYVSKAYDEVRLRQQELVRVIYCTDCESTTHWQRLLSALSNLSTIKWVSHPDNQFQVPILQKPVILPTKPVPAPLPKPTHYPTTEKPPTYPSAPKPPSYDYIYYPSISSQYGSYSPTH